MAELVAAVLRNAPAAPRRSGCIRRTAAGSKGAAARRSALMNAIASGTASRTMPAPAARWPGRPTMVVPTTTAMTAAVNAAAAATFSDPQAPGHGHGEQTARWRPQGARPAAGRPRRPGASWPGPRQPRRRQSRWRGPTPRPAPCHDRPPPLRPVGSDGGEQPQRRGHRCGRRRSLHAAGRRQQHDHGHRAQQCSGGDDGEAGGDRAPVAESVTQPRSQHQQPAEKHGVTAGHQAAQGRRLQAGQHPGQRGDHHGHSQHIDELHRAQRHDRQGAAAYPAACRHATAITTVFRQ